MSILVSRIRLNEATFLIGGFPRLGLHHRQGDCYGLSRFIRAPFIPGVYLITVSCSYRNRRHLPQQPGGCEAVPRAQTRKVLLGCVTSGHASCTVLTCTFSLQPLSRERELLPFQLLRWSRQSIPLPRPSVCASLEHPLCRFLTLYLVLLLWLSFLLSLVRWIYGSEGQRTESWSSTVKVHNAAALLQKPLIISCSW
jgi:hypothetical protein